MNRYVVDASVAIKWYVAEPGWEAATRLLNPIYSLIAPEFLQLEVGNILWKHVRRGEFDLKTAETIATRLRTAPIHFASLVPDLDDALRLAVEFSRTVYDSLYVALAIREHARMVTADQKLYNALQHTRLSPHLLWVEDVQ